MSKHTPGPWTTKPCSNGGRLLCRGDWDTHRQSMLQIVPEDDAYLIAAAPDLYEALERLTRYGNVFGYPANERSPYQQAMAALARARGEAA